MGAVVWRAADVYWHFEISMDVRAQAFSAKGDSL
jgi:hypothetical protein